MTLGVGEHVRVSDRVHDGHHRTPAYLKGRHGTIARVHATFPDPETRAYGESGLPGRRLYLVDFGLERSEDRPGAVRILADLFEHWLEPV